jgi:polar amino acid transport system substrate-binding protein
MSTRVGEAVLRRLIQLPLFPLLAVACAPQQFSAQTPAAYQSAANCAQVNRDNLYAAAGYVNAYLTVASGDPAFPPWWDGGTTDEHSDWKLNDPYLGQGYEGAVTFEVAERLGFSEDRVRFVPIGFDESFAPGPKRFDFALEQIPYLPERLEDVDLSEGYYDVNLALVSLQGSPIATAASLEELNGATLGAIVGTTSLRYVDDSIRPSRQPIGYDDLPAAVQALREGRVDGIVVDLPSATFITEGRIRAAVIVGRLPVVGSRERFVMVFEKGSPIVECVNLALREMKEDGTLGELRREWLAEGKGVPLIGT